MDLLVLYHHLGICQSSTYHTIRDVLTMKRGVNVVG